MQGGGRPDRRVARAYDREMHAPNPLTSTDPRRRILSAAATVFAARGFNGGSLNDIAVGARMTRPGVLHHYPSKQAVLLALLEQRDRQIQEASQPSDDWSLADVVAALPGQFAFILRERELVALAHALTAEASDPDHPARTWVLARHSALRASFGDAIRRSQLAGEVDADIDPIAAAAALLGAIEGIENQWLVSPDTFNAAAALAIACRAFLAGLAPRGT
jgi:AcrR family transcriptional regulator